MNNKCISFVSFCIFLIFFFTSALVSAIQNFSDSYLDQVFAWVITTPILVHIATIIPLVISLYALTKKNSKMNG
jgi:hypothetical protein